MSQHAHEGGGASRSTDPAAGTSSATDVSLREVVTSWRKDDNARVLERFGWLIALIGTIWFFIERHLAELNHENARVATIAAATVSEDTYKSDKARTDDERDKLDDWRASVDEKFTKSLTRDDLSRETKGDRQILTGNLLALVSLLAVVSGVIGHYLFH
jgi:hypothetical protein